MKSNPVGTKHHQNTSNISKIESRRIIVCLIPGIIAILIASNYHSQKVIFRGLPVYPYGSLNSDFEFHSVPWKGMDMEMMMERKEIFDQEHQVKTVICRKFPRNYWRFWNWWTYWRDPYYQFPVCDELKN